MAKENRPRQPDQDNDQSAGEQLDRLNDLVADLSTVAQNLAREQAGLITSLERNEQQQSTFRELVARLGALWTDPGSTYPRGPTNPKAAAPAGDQAAQQQQPPRPRKNTIPGPVQGKQPEPTPDKEKSWPAANPSPTAPIPAAASSARPNDAREGGLQPTSTPTSAGDTSGPGPTFGKPDSATSY